MPKWLTATVILVVCAGPFACQRQEPLYVFAKAGLYRVVPDGENVKVSDDIKPDALRVVKRVMPEWAPATTEEGPVILEVIVGRDGLVEEVEVIRSVPAIDAATVAAFEQWEYEPILLNGEPIRLLLIQTVNRSPGPENR